jgi:16S rRNA (cytosine967-C5)-methyltransferase
LRWQANKNIDELVKLQEKALDYAANFVRPGGILVYSTCTLNPAENEEQIKKFLKRNPKFTLVNAKEILPSDFVVEGMFKTLPFKHDMDGAFAAKMRKSR